MTLLVILQNVPKPPPWILLHTIYVFGWVVCQCLGSFFPKTSYWLDQTEKNRYLIFRNDEPDLNKKLILVRQSDCKENNTLTKCVFCLQAQDSILLSEDFRIQLEQVQQRLNLVREEVVENSLSREKESFNARRAQVIFEAVRRHKCRGPAVEDRTEYT